MVMQKAKSDLAKRLGASLDGAIKKHAGDPADYGNMRLPPGVNNGVARLTKVSFGIYNKGSNEGKDYIMFSGTAIEPETVMDRGEEKRVAGCQSNPIIPLCDTKTTQGKVTSKEEHVEKVLNEMRILGVDTSQMQEISDIIEYAEMLTVEKPYFKFSTSLKPAVLKPDGTVQYAEGVWENWYGSKGLENYTEPEDTSVVDNTPAEAPSKPATASKAAPTPNSPSKTQATPTGNGKAPPAKPASRLPAKKEPEPAPFTNIDHIGDEDTDLLVKVAADDEHPNCDEARERLSKLAEAAGATEDEITAAPGWEEVAALITTNESTAAATTEGDEGTGEWEPKAKEVYNYLPIDQKTKKPVKGVKPVQCEVISVNVETKKVTLKNLDSPKTSYMNVPFDQLIGD